MAEQRLRNILHDMQGAAVVEYAIVLPVLLLLICGIVEYDLVMYGEGILDGATTFAAREGKTGYAPSGESQQTYIYGIVQSRVSGFLNPNQLNISSKSYASFSGIGQPEPCIPATQSPPCNQPLVAGQTYVDVNHNGQWDSDEGAAGLGGANDIVVYTVTYPWHVTTPFLQSVLGVNGIFTLSASAVVKNEPYSVNR
jgi:Flp pilus assembly pilin Flp